MPIISVFDNFILQIYEMTTEEAVKILDDFIIKSDETIFIKHKLLECISVLLRRDNKFHGFDIVYKDSVSILLKRK